MNKWLAGLVLAVAVGALAAPALAWDGYGGYGWHGGYWRGGYGWRGGYWNGYYDPWAPPLYWGAVVTQPVYENDMPPIIVQQPAQPQTVVVQQSVPAAATVMPGNGQGTWYYCPALKAYYPYVNACPKGWKLVPATPPDLH